jgi:transcriptional regulator with GAF, ATPase, and Fis domain
MSGEFPETSASIGTGLPKQCAEADRAIPSQEGVIRQLQADRAEMAQRIQSLEGEQRGLLERYVGLEEQNSFLTTLYVASQRLHSALEKQELLQNVREIIANLIGCEEYVLFNLAKDGWLHRVDSLGVDPAAHEKVLPYHGHIGWTVRSGRPFVLGGDNGEGASRIEPDLTACIPLKLNGTVTGVITLFRLLPQKQGLNELDRELFSLLENQLAVALHCADLHARAALKNGVAA